MLMAFFAITSSAYDFSATHTFQVLQDNIPIDYENELYYAINEDGASVTLVQGPSKYSYYYISIPATVSHRLLWTGFIRLPSCMQTHN